MLDKRGGSTSVGSILHHRDITLEVLEYIDSNHRKVLIKETGTVIDKLHCHQIRTGQVRDPNKPSVQGVGYLGQGAYKCKVNGVQTRSYSCWSNMINRCYDKSNHSSHRYLEKGVRVCKEWHNFQNFASWFNLNYVEGFELDKDIYGGNIYSPSTCVFIPKPLNTFFTGRFVNRGEYPIGVLYHKPSKAFVASVNNGKGETKHLGCFDSPESAFMEYKRVKEGILLEMAGRFLMENLISIETYNILKKWECVPYPE